MCRKHFYYEETGDKKHDLLVNAQKMATIMEEFIKAHPADWMWFQHLFWTEPWSIEMYCRMTDEEKEEIIRGVPFVERAEAVHEKT